VAGSDKEHRGLFPPFDRRFFESDATFTRVGTGVLGGKAEGLAFVHAEVISLLSGGCPNGVEVSVPRMMVIASDMFDAFMQRNRLEESAADGAPDERVAHAFMQGELPAEMLGDLQALVESVRSPLAVRSSSLLEDALAHPFAGVYGTKMIPNHQPAASDRFAKLTEAVKFVYASTYFSAAKAYRQGLRIPEGQEKMAVIVQEVIGERHGSRFYPEVSGVARSYSYYPLPGARSEEGMVSLALGLGKTVVDGGTCWTYTPSRPSAPPPVGSGRALLDATQTNFWAVNMGAAPYDPARETEYLFQPSLQEAEGDGTLLHLASTYDAVSDRVRPGIGRPGPRVLNFGPMLELSTIPLNDCVRAMLACSRERLGCEVEVEFAACLAGRRRETTKLGFLQLRPMASPGSYVTVDVEDLWGDEVLLASERCLGNAVVSDIRDVVYVKPGSFDAGKTGRIAQEVGAMNRALLAEGRKYVLIGFGRWGTSDPWLGIPVEWGQISGAGVLVEAALDTMQPEMSQGSHFFHNLVSTHTLFFSVPLGAGPQVDWQWLKRQEVVRESDHVRHVRAATPLSAHVDGRSGRGVVMHHG